MAGISMLALSAVRLLWRLLRRPPADGAMQRWQSRLDHRTRYALYFLFFATPLVGCAYSSAAGFPVALFRIISLPDLVSANKELAIALRPWRDRLAYGVAILVVMHVAGALKHHLIDRDGILRRTRPW